MPRPSLNCFIYAMKPTPITASRKKIHAQYLLLPLRAFSSMLATSNHIVDTRLSPEFRLSPDRILFSDQFPHIGIGVLQIAEYNRSVRRLSACRLFADCEPFVARSALFNNADHTGRELLVLDLDGMVLPRIDVIET